MTNPATDAIVHLASGTELRVGVDRVKPWLWLMVLHNGRRDSFPLEAHDEVPALVDTIVRVRQGLGQAIHACVLRPDQLIRIQQTDTTLLLVLHNLRRSHESRIRTAALESEEIGALLAALDEQRDAVLGRGADV